MKLIVVMNRFFIAAVLLMALASCQSSKVKISGRFVGSDAKVVYIEKATNLKQEVIDSVSLNEDGNFTLLLDKADARRVLMFEPPALPRYIF